jgi:tetratricopeptide (TPR) repeat protein
VLRDGARWRYHLVVREQMLRYLGQKSPKRYGEVHGKLAVYYEGLRNGLRLEVGKEAEDETWREHSLEWVYHELCAAPQAKLGLALNGFLRALKHSRNFAKPWAESMRQSGQESKCETLRKWGDQLRDSLVARDEERYEDAIPVLSALLDESGIEEPLKSIAFNFRGVWHRKSKKGELALNDFQKAIDFNRNDPDNWFELGRTYADLEDYDKALLAYQSAIEINRENSTFQIFLAISYFKKGEIEQAIYASQRSINLEPKMGANRPSFLHILGSLHAMKQNYDNSILCFQEAIEIDPENANSYHTLGGILQIQNRHEEAIKAYQMAVAVNPKDANFHNSLGDYYSLQNNFKDAILSYKESIEINPECQSSFLRRGTTYCSMECYEEALSDFDQAIELAPHDSAAIALRGCTYQLLKCYEEALREFSRAIDLDPEYAWAMSKRGEIYEILGDYQNAIKDFDTAISIYHSKIELGDGLDNAQSSLGYLQYKLGDYEASTECFRKLVELQPDNPSYPSNLAYLYLLQGDADEAQRIIDTLMKDVSIDRFWLNSGLIQAQLGQLDAAIASWQKGLEMMDEASDWEKAVRHVFTIALGNSIEGLENMRKLIDAGTDRFTLRNALNDATILSRCPQTIDGIDQVIQLLEEALAKFEPISFPDHSQAQQVKQLLQGAIDATQPTTL